MAAAELREIRIVPLQTLPEIRAGDDLPLLIHEATVREGHHFENGCAVVIAQKAVSKAEGRVVELRDIQPSVLAESYAREHGKDARVIEVILRQSRRVVKMDRGVLLVETHLGLVCANAGVDASNVAEAGAVTLLPLDPDGAAQALRHGLEKLCGCGCAVVISDTFGRPWREGLVNVAIGVAGFRPLEDYRGRGDRQGRLLSGTVIATADELAAAAGLMMQKAAGSPVVLIFGAALDPAEGSARALIRPPEKDLFR